MKIKYNRHQDPRRGFKLLEQFEIPREQKLQFEVFIERINKIYSDCAESQSKALISQPSENQMLLQVSVLLICSLFFIIIFSQYAVSFLISFLIIVCALYRITKYLKQINLCRKMFALASLQLQREFSRIQSDFDIEWPSYKLSLVREWEENKKVDLQYLLISQKHKELQLINANRINT